jgi:hypothetical protein
MLFQMAGVTESKDALLARLLAMEPKDLLKEIVSGRVPVSILDRVTERLPAEMLQEAVDFLTKTDKSSCSSEGESSSAGSKTVTQTSGSGSTTESAGPATSAAGSSIMDAKSSASSKDSDNGNGKMGTLKRKLEGFDVSKVMASCILCRGWLLAILL